MSSCGRVEGSVGTRVGFSDGSSDRTWAREDDMGDASVRIPRAECVELPSDP